MRLIRNDNSHIVKHILDSPRKVIRNDDHLDTDFQRGLLIVDQLNLMRLDVGIPTLDLVLPVKFEGWRANDQQRPFVSVNVCHCQ
jgi:hypothetical protein